jgi:hypothetical protein
VIGELARGVLSTAACMPSFDHEILVELFRNEGELAAELLRRCAGISVDYARADCGTNDLSQIAPAEYRADAVAILRGGDDAPVLGVIVEVQRQLDPMKLLTWPVYVAALRARLECPAVLLVVAPDPTVAAWARRTIELGHPGFALAPIVIGFEDVPRVRDRAAASRLPELAVLSVLAHRTLDDAAPAFAALDALPDDRRQLYLDVIMIAVPAIRQILEGPMKDYQYRSEFGREAYGNGHDKGLAKGQVQGQLAGLRAAVTALARAKIDELRDGDLATLETVADPRALTELITTLGFAEDADEARMALDQALGR